MKFILKILLLRIFVKTRLLFSTSTEQSEANALFMQVKGTIGQFLSKLSETFKNKGSIQARIFFKDFKKLTEQYISDLKNLISKM